MNNSKKQLKLNNDIRIIVKELFENGKFYAYLRKYKLSNYLDENEELKKDLTSEIIIILLTYKDPEKLIRMYAKNELDKFILRIIRNQVHSAFTLYYKKYAKWEYNRNTYDTSN